MLYSANYTWVLPSYTIHFGNFWFLVWHVRHLEVIIPIHTTRKNLINWKWLLLYPPKNCSQRASCFPLKLERQTGKYRQLQNAPEHTLMSRISEGTLWSRKTWTVNAELLQVRCGQVWELTTPRGQALWASYTFLGFTSRSPSRFSWWRKSPGPSNKRRRKVGILKYTRALCS